MLSFYTNYVRAFIRTHMKSERGATAVEYGIMVALIAVVIIAAVTLLGGNLSKLFDHAAKEIKVPAAG